MTDRETMQEYAEQICLSILERTANRFLSGGVPEVADWAGYESTMLENLFRPFWGIAPLLNGTKTYTIRVAEQEKELCSWLRETLLDGTDPNSPRRFDRYSEITGHHFYANQSMTEFAGLLIGIYFAKEAVWEPLNLSEKDQIAKFILHWAEIAIDNSWQNNHYWFPMFALLILKQLGYQHERYREMIDSGFSVLDSLYLEKGWYADGAFGRFDYYLAWSHNTYPLLWSMIEDENEPGHHERFSVYKKRTEEFLEDFIYWFDSTGSHVPFGRSLSYRFAASCIFPIAALAGCEIDLGLARNITMKNMTYFENNSLPMKDGILPPGFLYEAPALVENYTSDGGSYWCAKTFMALLMDEKHPFWNAEKTPYPAQMGDYLHLVGPDTVNMMFSYSEHSGTTLFNNTASYYQGRHSHRFSDMAGYYSKFVYNSRTGFGASSRDNVSLDCMIGLMTPDCSMTSHRLGFLDLGYKDGGLYSRHTPFANDAGTIVDTAVIPLGKGHHVRAHKIKLASPYRVVEGGFSLSSRNDYSSFSADKTGCVLKTDTMISQMAAVSATRFTYERNIIQPGFHLFAPLACYPCYMTGVLDEGCYLFATWFYSGDLGKQQTAPPRIKLEGNTVLVDFENQSYSLDMDAAF